MVVCAWVSSKSSTWELMPFSSAAWSTSGRSGRPNSVAWRAVDRDRGRIGVITQMGEPARLGHHEVEVIAVDHEVAAAIGTGMDMALGNLNAAEMSAVVFTQKLIMIAWNVDRAGAFARLAQELLNHV